jgi:excinuclease ABC subunit C
MRASWYVENIHTLDEVPLYQEYLLSYYRDHKPTHIILTNINFSEHALVESFLTQLHAYATSVAIIRPAKGHYYQLLQLALKMQQKMFLAKSEAALQLQKWCGLPKPPSIIDCFDISHMQGTVVVGASVRFVDGRPDQSGFRNFIIKSFQGNNDYAALQEIVVRRYKDESEYADLMIIDGGKGQLSAVKQVFSQIPIASLAKKEERLFTDLHPDGIILDCKAAAGQQIIALRDYTHHAAVTFHRKRTKKERLLKNVKDVEKLIRSDEK